MEMVVSLAPDLVLASATVPGHEHVIEGLKESGLDYLAFEPVRLQDVYHNIREIACALEVAERGERLIDEMKAHFSSQYLAKPPTLLVQWWNRPTIVPGRFSWVTELIELAGGRNPWHDVLAKSQPIDDHQVALINPDAIILSWCGVQPEKYRPEVIYRNPQWQHVKAVQNGRVFCVPEAYLGRPSPGLIKGFDALKKIVAQVDANR